MSQHELGGPTAPVIMVMGVSGSGKTSLGKALAARLGLAFLDGDDFHPPANVAKMADGGPLTDEDRWPWLDRLGQAAAAQAGGAVVACSALKRAYRDRLRLSCPRMLLVYIAGDPALIGRRLEGRRGHFMPKSLLASQFDALEPPGADEAAVAAPAAMGPARQLDKVCAELRRLGVY
jgi:gluconokinase